ncbi:uncharacterized protein BP01DRAFT_353560 [Aspergillus saccharolyticus JOP 1030-1]|uniref:Uncharacterized protein n=1 Tax=Aspergillus saccharolyticus JOP 1030-1 TaxID=1450539 RepID=A0A318ZLC1_9EURO|nr:hypothetical protein BP01DRAFT_353560 [Aspergillus saccharolyticus JOP 1030-1]PYH48411.1 hypothetical protein BP01DRAFT_353560 [Aspergillus saccharolyticus JOP 1030-1]
MRCENVKTAIPKKIEIVSLGIIYSAACIACVLLLLQRIRRRRLRYAQLARQMDPLSSSLEKGGGEGPASPGRQGYRVAYQDLTDPIGPNISSSFPSACDVLQPLSHFSELPSSGHLAAILTRERSSWTRPPYPLEEPALSVSGDADMKVTAISSTCQDGDFGSSISERVNGGSIDSSAPPRTGLSPVGWRTTSHSQEPPAPKVAESSSGPHTARKSGHAVQYMREEDEEGVRSWKRVVVEYS